ncbi:S24 family peptidase, partial [Vibrio harveyi]
MEDISDRIKLKRLELRLNQRELAKKLRLTAPSVSQWERGVSEPKGNNLINLAKVFRTTPEWLLTGMEKNLDEPLCICVPLLENVLAAGGDGATNDDFTSISTVPVPSYVTKHRNINQIVSIQVMGDSMEPMLYDGGLVVIDKSEVSIRDGKVYVFRQDGMLRVKRLVLISGGVLIKSQNPAY